MKRGASHLVVLISLMASLYLFVSWLPAQVTVFTAEIALRTQPGGPGQGALGAVLPEGDLTKTGDEESLSPELIQYIAAQQKTAATFSDKLSEDEIIETFESFQEDYALRADDVFKRFETVTPPPNDEIAITYSSADFEAPPGLEDTVLFWENIFGVYDKNVIVFHNARSVGLVYSVLDFTDLARENVPDFDEVKDQAVREEKQRLTRLLKNLSEKFSGANINYAALDKEEKRLVELLEKNPEVSVASLSSGDNLKITAGYAHRFRQAVAKSGQYMPEIMRIFRRYGLPLELTCIPFVESSFAESAMSHAGAAGIWQFISETGRHYLRIDDYVDERYDPILSTHAAAKHLATEYRMLRSWPLTVNAYNTGPGRIQDAVRDLGTRDIAEISRRYEGSGYGYDSRNYFPELLAAVKVYRNYRRYFGDVNILPEQPQEYIVMPSATNVKQLFRLAGVSATAMQDLNLMLKPAILSGDKNLPKGYLIKVMPGAKEDMLIAAHDLYRQNRNAAYHLATRGETLEDIADLYDVDVKELAVLNKMGQNDKLTAGTMLKVPGPAMEDTVSLQQNHGNFLPQGHGTGFRDGVEAVIEQDMQTDAKDGEDEEGEEQNTDEDQEMSDIIF